MISRVLVPASRIDDEFQQIFVRIPHVHARPGDLPAADAADRTRDDPGACPLQHGPERVRRAVPGEAQVAARRLRRGGPQREGRVLPQRRAMEIDHLGPEMDGAALRALDHLKTEPLVEREHGFNVLHRERDVVESSNAAGLPLRARTLAGGGEGRGGCACANRVLDEGASRADHDSPPGSDSLMLEAPAGVGYHAGTTEERARADALLAGRSVARTRS